MLEKVIFSTYERRHILVLPIHSCTMMTDANFPDDLLRLQMRFCHVFGHIKVRSSKLIETIEYNCKNWHGIRFEVMRRSILSHLKFRKSHYCNPRTNFGKDPLDPELI